MNYDSPCYYVGKPRIGGCNYDAAYETLEHIYGKLKVMCHIVLGLIGKFSN